jgi:hypothetical protein
MPGGTVSSSVSTSNQSGLRSLPPEQFASYLAIERSSLGFFLVSRNAECARDG